MSTQSPSNEVASDQVKWETDPGAPDKLVSIESQEYIDLKIAEERETLLEELAYLRWFYQAADFGPAHGDVIYVLQENYVEQGGVIPEGYRDEE